MAVPRFAATLGLAVAPAPHSFVKHAAYAVLDPREPQDLPNRILMNLAEFVSASALLKRNWFWAALLLLCAPSDGSTASELLLHADIALVHAKADGG